jgi:hypothetical protein
LEELTFSERPLYFIGTVLSYEEIIVFSLSHDVMSGIGGGTGSDKKE